MDKLAHYTVAELRDKLDRLAGQGMGAMPVLVSLDEEDRAVAPTMAIYEVAWHEHDPEFEARSPIDSERHPGAERAVLLSPAHRT